MGVTSHLRHSLPCPASSKWQNLKRCLCPRKTRDSAASADNQLTVATMREEDRSSAIVLSNTRTIINSVINCNDDHQWYLMDEKTAESILKKLKGMPYQALREFVKDYFDTRHCNLLLLDDINDYLDLIISISNSFNEHDEVSDINLLSEKINRFKKARDPFPPLSEMVPLLSEEKRKTRQTIQVLKEKMDSKTKRFKFWKKVTRVVSWSAFLIAFAGALSLLILVPSMVQIAIICSTIIRPLEEQILSFYKTREAELKEMIKVVDAIKEASVLEHHQPMIGSFDNSAIDDTNKLKLVLDRLIQDKEVGTGKEVSVSLQMRVIEIKEEVEKWRRFIKQTSMDVVSSLK